MSNSSGGRGKRISFSLFGVLGGGEVGCSIHRDGLLDDFVRTFFRLGEVREENPSKCKTVRAVRRSERQ